MAILFNKLHAKVSKVVNTESKEFRKTLNSDIHVVDLSKSALRYSDKDLSDETYEIILDSFREILYNSNSLSYVIKHIRNPRSGAPRDFAALVEDPEFGVFIVGRSYSAVQTRVSKTLKKLGEKFEDLSQFTGVDENNKTVTNIGHIPSSVLSSTRSPLQTKISELISLVPRQLAHPLKLQLERLYDVHFFDTEYVFSRNDIDTSKLQNILGKCTVLVTLHSSTKNNELSILEANIEREVSKYINSKEFQDAILEAKGSNSIKEDIVLLISDAIKGKKSISTHRVQKTSNKEDLGTSKLNVTTSQLKTQLRNLKGIFTSLASLQALLNQALHDQIKRNMGTGNETRVLNYRSGRFAHSARVEKMSQSREGMITAFYHWMKYPYATFSEGGRQQNPRSRDPKLLISKSIREIGASLVKNRMRAVCL